MKPALDSQIHNLLNERLSQLENHYEADILTYFGPFEGGSENVFLKIVEEPNIIDTANFIQNFQQIPLYLIY